MSKYSDFHPLPKHKDVSDIELIKWEGFLMKTRLLFDVKSYRAPEKGQKWKPMKNEKNLGLRDNLIGLKLFKLIELIKWMATGWLISLVFLHLKWNEIIENKVKPTFG